MAGNPPYFITGDAFTGGYFWIALKIPNAQDNWVMSVLLGALDNMGAVDAWITGGETTTEEAAIIFRGMKEGVRLMPWDIGDIKFTGAPPTSATWLLCDGSQYPESTYPDLFAAIGTAFNTGGESPGNFRVPDMRGRVAAMTNNSSARLPSWGDAPGGTGGESSHTLVTVEMPGHSHTDSGHSHSIPSFLLTGTSVPPPLDAGSELPVPTTNSGSGTANLSSTGGDGAHNNVQPTLTLACYILAAF